MYTYTYPLSITEYEMNRNYVCTYLDIYLNPYIYVNKVALHIRIWCICTHVNISTHTYSLSGSRLKIEKASRTYVSKYDLHASNIHVYIHKYMHMYTYAHALFVDLKIANWNGVMYAPTLRSIRFTDSRNAILVGVRHICIYIYMCIHIYTYTTYRCVYIDMYINTRMHTYARARVHTHTHTHLLYRL